MLFETSGILRWEQPVKLNHIVAVVMLLCTPFVGCKQRSGAKDLPQELVLIGKTQEFIAFLNSAKIFEDSPLTGFIADFSDHLGNCEDFEVVCDSLDACTLEENTGCRGGHRRLKSAYRLLGDAEWMLSSNRANRQRITAWGSTHSNHRYEITAELTVHSDPGLSALFMPAAEAPARAALAEKESLLHFLIRPDRGLSLDSFLTAGSIGNKLFQLKSDLFLATTLEGTWEAAFYSPDLDDLIPPMAVALHFRNRKRAVRAMEDFLGNLMNTWPIRRSPYSLDSWSGACLSNLRVMPNLAPCYVATDRSLIVGWNPASMELALAQPSPDQVPATASSARVEFDRVAKTDRILSAAPLADDSRSQSSYSWTTAQITGKRVGDLYQLKLELSVDSPR